MSAGQAGLVVTIDGPAASGKSSVAKLLAGRLGVAYLSSGLLYRAATRLTLDAGVDPADGAAVTALLRGHDVELLAEAAGNRVIVDGTDLTGGLNSGEVDANVSAVASQPEVRAWVTERLKDVRGSFVIDGRDMGTAVFPDAAVKVYLTADLNVRACRRLPERNADLAEVAAQLERRDRLDSRQSAPATDATVIDTSELTLPEVLEAVAALVSPAAGRDGPPGVAGR